MTTTFAGREALTEKWASIQLKGGTDAWDTQILGYLAQEFPYLVEGSDYTIGWTDSDPSKGYGMGALQLANMPRPQPLTQPEAAMARGRTPPERTQVSVPLMVKEFRLVKPSVLITYPDGMGEGGGEPVPFALTKTRFAQVMMRPDLFQEVDYHHEPHTMAGRFSPGFVPPLPPYATAQGNLPRSVKHASDESLLEVLASEPGLVEVQDVERATEVLGSDTAEVRRLFKSGEEYGKRVLMRVYTVKPTSDDNLEDAKRSILPVSVVRFTALREIDKVRVTRVSDVAYSPMVCELDMDEVQKEFGSQIPDIMDLIHENHDLVVQLHRETANPIILEDYRPSFERAATPGRYYIPTRAREILEGWVVPQFCDWDGAEGLAAVAFSAGRFDVQDDVVAEKIDGEMPEGKVQLKNTEIGHWYLICHDGKCYPPFRVAKKPEVGCGYSNAVQVADIYGRSIFLTEGWGVDKVVNKGKIDNPDLASLVAGSASVYMIPRNVLLVPVGIPGLQTMTSVPEAQQFFDRAARSGAGLMAGPNMVNDGTLPWEIDVNNLSLLWNGGWHLSGQVLEPIVGNTAFDCDSDIDLDWILAILGVDLEETASLKARAKELGRITIANVKPVEPFFSKAASSEMLDQWVREQFPDDLRRDLLKVAVTVTSEGSIDKVLGTNFINARNLSIFLERLPDFQEMESQLGELWLKAAAGAAGVDEAEVRDALLSVSRVVDRLTQLSSFTGEIEEGSRPS